MPRSIVTHDRYPCTPFYNWCPVDRPLVLQDQLSPTTIRAAVRQQVPGFFSGARLRVFKFTDGILARGSQSHKLQGHDPPHRQQEIVRGRASPAYSRRNPPTHGPRARAAELRWTSTARWVCHMPLFPSSAVSHPGDMRAGGTRSDKTLERYRYRSPPTVQRSWSVGNCKAGHMTTAYSWNKSIVYKRTSYSVLTVLVQL